jgi:ADP-ribose pyrophosphatase
MSDAESIPPTTASERKYSGRVISLDVDTVRFPDGSTGQLEIIRHPGASAVLPFLDDPNAPDPHILLIRQYRYAAGEFLLEIPAGRLEGGESAEACAARELREETGRAPRRLRKVFELFTTPGFTDEKIHIFFGWDLELHAHAREPDEFITELCLKLSEAATMVTTGAITDAKTALAILLASQLKERR